MTLARFVAWQARAAAGISAVVPFAGGRLYCPAERQGLSELAYIFRDRYEGEIAALHQVVRPGMTVLDIGAHYGPYTVTLAQLVGPTGLVVAVEPSSHAVAVLERNVSLNGLENVLTMRAAVSDEAGEPDRHPHSDPSRTHLAAGGAPQDVETVRVVTIDGIREEIDRRIDFLKIDVQGTEAMAFNGGELVLRQDRPVVLFESAPEAEERMGLAPGSGWRALRDCGYGAYAMGTDKPVTVDPTTYVEKVFALPAERVAG